ncbi:MAG: hypothetical protein ABR991_02215 [Terracidiphilus sp.]
MIVAVISTAAGVVVASLSFYFSKKKDREADWRKYKYEQYKEFMVSVGSIAGTDSTPEGNRSFAKASNTLHLIGTKGVIVALHAYQDEIRSSNSKHSVEIHDALLSKLIWEIRKDLGIPGTPETSDFSVHMWCSGANESKRNP